jgi:hypothetical protein
MAAGGLRPERTLTPCAAQGQELGPLHKINIGFASKRTAAGALANRFGAAWRLSHVEVTDVAARPSAPYVFRLDGWIRPGETQGRVDITEGAAAGGNLYSVQILTSDVRGAGTDAAVRLTLFGRHDDGTQLQHPAMGELGTALAMRGLVGVAGSGSSRCVRSLLLTHWASDQPVELSSCLRGLTQQ